MKAEPAGPPVKLNVRAEAPDGTFVGAVVPVDATVGEFVTRVMAQRDAQTPSAHDLRVPLSVEDDSPRWYTLDPDETLIDALRGVQQEPRIVEKYEVGREVCDGDT